MNEAQTALDLEAGNREVVLASPWLGIGRGIWLVSMAALVVSFAALASRGSRALLTEPNVEDSYAALAQYLSYSSYAGLILASRYLVFGIFVATGLFIFWRKSNTMMGLVASLEVMTLPFVAGLGGQAPSYPESLNLTLTSISQITDGFLYVVWLAVTLLFIGLFPNGRFPHKWLKPLVVFLFALVSLALVAPLLASSWDGPARWLIMIVCIMIGMAVAIAGAINRYFRISTPIEKRQTRWVLASLVLVVLWASLIPQTNPFRSWDARAAPYASLQLFGTVVIASLVPLSIARAITRYHLWDVDVVIRKTLTYSLLTGTLIIIYLVSILLLQRVFTAITGQDSQLATIMSTLLIAALFLPLRGRIQDAIDRRFFRSKYDAARVLEEFAATARDETDLDALTAELLRVIQETMQPEHLSLWLRAEALGETADAFPLVTFQRYGVDSASDSD